MTRSNADCMSQFLFSFDIDQYILPDLDSDLTLALKNFWAAKRKRVITPLLFDRFTFGDYLGSGNLMGADAEAAHIPLFPGSAKAQPEMPNDAQAKTFLKVLGMAFATFKTVCSKFFALWLPSWSTMLANL